MNNNFSTTILKGSMRLSIFLPLLLTFLCSSLMSSLGRPKVWVQIFNKAKDRSDIVVRCWSSEDDLGPHTLSYDQMYQFPFRTNIWGTTKFRCQVQFKDGFYRDYLTYRQSRDGCRHCIWHLYEDKACNLVVDYWKCYGYVDHPVPVWNNKWNNKMGKLRLNTCISTFSAQHHS